jgi:predicted enzyme related to lactoylglutathione lyase
VPKLSLSTVNLGGSDPVALAHFYARLLDWEITVEEEHWVLMRPPGKTVGLSFQHEPLHVEPVWPAGPGDQQMQIHLEIRVDDLAGAVEHALACGATLAEHQPQETVRVCLDPAGHPFCLWLG